LLATVLYFQVITIIDFDASGQRAFNRLRVQRPGVGTLVLWVAAIALSQDATLMTRNRQNFAGIPSLRIEDGSLFNLPIRSTYPPSVMPERGDVAANVAVLYKSAEPKLTIRAVVV
jgi:hypothetical protein